ncbi:MAG TPA: hypothetical protein VF937_12140 [Chloroflexota bacterium]
MAKTAKERQAAYRQRRPEAGKDGNGERRLNTWIGTSTSLALERLATRYGVTKRELLERLILAEDDRILEGMELDSPEWGAYFRVNALRRNGRRHTGKTETLPDQEPEL